MFEKESSCFLDQIDNVVIMVWLFDMTLITQNTLQEYVILHISSHLLYVLNIESDKTMKGT